MSPYELKGWKQLELAPGLLTPHTGLGTRGLSPHPSVGQAGTTQENKKDSISPHVLIHGLCLKVILSHSEGENFVKCPKLLCWW